jgi:hypothetical protein
MLNDNVDGIKSNEHVLSNDPKDCKSKSQDTRSNVVNDAPITESQYVYPCLKSYRCKYAKNGVIMYYNVNSLKHKFIELRKILDDALVDVLIIGESKLDETYVDAQFHVNNYKMYRHDRNSRGGGVMAYFNNIIPHRIRNDLNMYIVNGFLVFKQTFCKLMDEMFSDSQNIIVTGDLNFNMNEKNILSDICDVYRLKNKVNGNTCFKGDNGTLLDVFLVSNVHYFGECVNTDIGISDCHNIVGCSLKGNLPQNKKKIITYRSYKKFDIDKFNNDVRCNPIERYLSNDDVNKQMNSFIDEYTNVCCEIDIINTDVQKTGTCIECKEI